jgi:hypothetical protein
VKRLWNPVLPQVLRFTCSRYLFYYHACMFAGTGGLCSEQGCMMSAWYHISTAYNETCELGGTKQGLRFMSMPRAGAAISCLQRQTLDASIRDITAHSRDDDVLMKSGRPHVGSRTMLTIPIVQPRPVAVGVRVCYRGFLFRF